MRLKSIFVLGFLPLMLCSLTMKFNLAEIKATDAYPVHNLDTGLDYATIQEAVDAPETLNGHTIFVENGVYYEHLIVNKSVSLIGENREMTIIDGNGTGTVVNVTANNVNITCFKIQNIGGDYGIYVSTNSNMITDNIIIGGHSGIRLQNSYDNTLNKNQITANKFFGIALKSSCNNIISGNSIINNERGGICLFSSSLNNTISNNNIANAYYGDGIGLSSDPNGGPKNNSIFRNNITSNMYGIGPDYGAQHNSIFENYIANNTCGFRLAGPNNTIFRNNIINNKEEGIFAEGPLHGTSIFENNITENFIGLYVDMSANISIYRNIISNNTEGGLYLYYSSNITLSDNQMSDNRFNLWVYGNEITHYMHIIDSSNTVDGKSVYYWVNHQNETVPTDAGYVGIINSTHIVVQNLELRNNGQGILIGFTKNSLITKNNIMGEFLYNGIEIFNSSFNVFSENNILTTKCKYSVYLVDSCNNSLFKNNIVNSFGYSGFYLLNSSNNYIYDNYLSVFHPFGNASIHMRNSNDNKVYHNSFIDGIAYTENSTSFWDDGYPSGGNYWTGYTGIDLHSGLYQNETGSDGIADFSYYIDENNRDRYPLMGKFYDFEVIGLDSKMYHVQVISNSTVSELNLVIWLSSPNQYLQPGQEFLLLYVEGENDTSGFCRVTIPKAMLNNPYTVLVDWTMVPTHQLNASNSTHTYLYFTYNHTKHEVIIIPEFPSTIILLLSLKVMFIAVMSFPAKPKRQKQNADRNF